VWRAFLDAHATITATLAQELQVERGLSIAWYDVLLNLSEAGGSLRMHELASRLVIHRSSLTRLIDRMEASGFVEREPCVDDKRGHIATITRDGREALRRAAPTHLRGVQEQFAQHLTESDVVALQRVFAKLPSAARDVS
jgi:DNA-binding MarR family transcriptional regulator